MFTTVRILVMMAVLVFCGNLVTSKAVPSPSPHDDYDDSCHCHGNPSSGFPPGPPGAVLQGPPASGNFNLSLNPPKIYWNITVPLYINYNTTPSLVVNPASNTTTVLPAAAAGSFALPNGTVLLPNGTVQFPNKTVLLTFYAPSAVLPVARLPSGTLMFSNGAQVAAGTVTSFPAPGVPLNATTEVTGVYPSVLLPDNTLVFPNGTIFTPGMVALPTMFAKGIIPNCLGIACHYATG